MILRCIFVFHRWKKSARMWREREWNVNCRFKSFYLISFQSLQIGCNHVRSIELFTESIHSKCPFMSITCDSYEAFKKGKCSNCNRDENFCIRFGFHSRPSYKAVFEKGHYTSSPIATYLLTADRPPFCSAHYKVTVKISGKKFWFYSFGYVINFDFRLGGKSATWRWNRRSLFKA